MSNNSYVKNPKNTRKYTNGAFGSKGFKEVEYDYVDNHGPRHKRTGKVERRTTLLAY